MRENRDRLSRLSREERARLVMRLKKRSAADEPDHIQPDPENRYAPFPLTDLQQAYWIGRSGSFQMGQVASHSYLEVEGEYDLPALEAALQKVIARHESLRTIVQPNGQQRVLEETPLYKIETTDVGALTPDAAQAAMDALRRRMSHQVRPSDQWPVFEIHAALLGGRRARLYVSLDALLIDGWSIAVLFREWAQAYREPDKALPDIDLTFRDYVLAERALEETAKFERDQAYWLARIDDLPNGPDLPLAKPPSELAEARFVRRHARLEAEQWTQLRARAKAHGLTPTGILLAAYADVVALWSQNERFLINVPQFNRAPLHPHVNDVIGEAASFSVVAVDMTGNDGFSDRAQRLQRQMWEDLDHSGFSGVKVLREVARSRGQTSGSLAPVIFTAAPQDDDGKDGYATLVAREIGEVVFSVNQTSQVWIDNHISEQDGGLICDWDSVDELFPPNLSADMLGVYFDLLNRLARDDAVWEMDWPSIAATLMPADQRERRDSVNDTAQPVPDHLMQDLFAAQVSAHADKPVVIARDRTLRYGELDQLANRWARRLRDMGVAPGDRVAIVMEKGWEQFVAAFAALKAGGAYVPIDSEQPVERLTYMIENCGAACILSQSWVDARLTWPDGARILLVDKESVDDWDATAIDPERTADDPAFVIYTSGSTGMPKGVVLSHRGVVNALLATNQRFDVGPDDVGFAIAALHHDLSIYDTFGLPAAGGTVVMPDPTGRRDPAHWSELMVAHNVTVWNSVPAMMVMLLEYADSHENAMPTELRLSFLGGDWVPVDVPQRIARHAKKCLLVTTGGPTETTLWNIWNPIEAFDPDWTSIPYGKPIANTRYYIMNEHFVERPDWVVGEMYVAGVGVAHGYLGDPKRSGEKFVLNGWTGERLCRTGDLGRYMPDGNIQFVGRADFQVKINGQRIELGEIEAALAKHPDISTAVVMAIGPAQKARRLAGFVVPQEGKTVVSDDLRNYLMDKVPDYMVPTAFVSLDRLPLTANGKVDRKALSALETEVAKPEAARSTGGASTTAKVAALVGTVMGDDAIDPAANLLSLGANSINMVQIGNEIEKAFGFRPRMDQIFRLQSINAIAAFCDRELGGADSEETKDTGEIGLTNEIREIIASFENIIDPCERDAFKNSQPGIRRDDADRDFVQLVAPEITDELRAYYANHRSNRRFGLQPIPLEQFSSFLACMYPIELNGRPKYLFASPGGLYPTQAYVHVKPARIEGIPGGSYYYHPSKHRLVSLKKGAVVDRGIHVPFVNTPVYDEAAFSIFLVVDLSAIAPSYGERSIFFATLEAGIMSVVLEEAARDAKLGICQMGGVDFDQIRDLFDLQPHHLYMHSLLGGPLFDGPDSQPVIRTSRDEENRTRIANLLERIRQLSPDEARVMVGVLKNEVDRGSEND